MATCAPGAAEAPEVHKRLLEVLDAYAESIRVMADAPPAMAGRDVYDPVQD